MKEEVAHALPYRFAKKHSVLLLPRKAQTEANSPEEAECIFPTAPALAVIAEIQRFTGNLVSFSTVSAEQFNKRMTEVYQDRFEAASAMSENLGDRLDLHTLTQNLEKTHDLLLQQDDAPIVQLLNAVISEAVNASASDLHIETFEQELTIRFRVDGMLHPAVTPPRQVAQLLVSRVKVMSKLDIAEKRLPQDGRMAVQVAGRLIDIRVSTMPTQHGERLVLRLLEKQAERLSLQHLGTSSVQSAQLRRLLEIPHGIILVTGPTGSGKTTSLYAALSYLNDGSRNILTIEDPVEYDLPGIAQSQVNHKIDMSFARGLRAILRQDPDIVMVGEIRDQETAEIAIQASMTGHLVLSTLHTNTAIGAITRLLDIGIEPFLISSSLLGVIAQRLVRKLCQDCKKPYIPTEEEHRLLGLGENPASTFYKGAGCAQCRHTGYSGRTALYEIIPADAVLRRQIHLGTSEEEMTESAHSKTESIRQDGLKKAALGVTSIDEVLRVTAAQGELKEEPWHS